MAKARTIKQLYETSPNPNRQLLPAGYLQHMPTKHVTREQFTEIKTHMDFNPIRVYAHLVKLYKYEVGYDQAYRYLIT